MNNPFFWPTIFTIVRLYGRRLPLQKVQDIPLSVVQHYDESIIL